jgi:ABC-2 type transport system permease protein
MKRLSNTVATFLAAGAVQIRTSLRAPEHLIVIFLAPWFSVVFLSMARATGREELATVMVLGTGLIGIWFVAVNVAAGAIHNDRLMGTLEMSFATPANYAIVICGRIVPIVGLGALAIPEGWLVARLLFSIDLPLRHPMLVVATLAITVLATAGTATLLASLMVLSRNTRIVQGNLEYPFYLLAGTVFPLAQLPWPLREVARVFYLSWASELLRDAISAEEVPGVGWRLAVIGVLGAAAMGLGAYLVVHTVRRSRRTGRVSLA